MPFLSLAWSNSLFFPIAQLGMLVKIVNVSFFMLSVGVIVRRIVKGDLANIYFFTGIAFLVFFSAWFSLIGYMNGFYSKNIADFYTLINGPIIAYAFYCRSRSWTEINKTSKAVSKIFSFSLAVCVVIMMIESILGIPHYPAIASGWAVLPLFIALYNKKYMVFIVVLLLVLLSGKRSILILFLTILPVALMWKRRSFKSSIFLGGIICAPLLGLVLLMLSQLESVNVSSLNKLQYINPFSEKFDLVVAAGERFEEVEASLEKFNESGLSSFIGMGNGFVYELSVDRKGLYEADRHNVHFTPVNYITKYGYPFTIVYYMVLVGFIFSVAKSSSQSRVVGRALVMYLVFGVVSSFISYSLPLDYMFWFAFGSLSWVKGQGLRRNNSLIPA